MTQLSAHLNKWVQSQSNMSERFGDSCGRLLWDKPQYQAEKKLAHHADLCEINTKK